MLSFIRLPAAMHSVSFRKAVVCLLAVSFIIPLQFLTKTHFPHELSAVDLSWMLGLGDAWHTNKIIGKDIVFTYGPLAFLSTRVLLNGHILPLLLFDVYVICTFVYIIQRIVSVHHTTTSILILLSTCFFYKQALLMSLVFSLQLIILLYLNEYRRKPHWLLLFQAILLSCIIFYIKLNMAFISITILLMFLGYLYLKQSISLMKAIAAAIALFLSIYLSSLILPVDLSSYITKGLLLIDSYSDAVYIIPAEGYASTLACIVYAVLVYFFMHAGIQILKKPFAEKILHALFFLLGFIVYKQCMVRADLEHIKDFFFLFPPFFVVYQYVTGTRAKGSFICLVLLWSISGYITYRFNDYYYPLKKIAAIPAYFYSMYEGYDYTALKNERRLPESVVRTIGKSSVDVIPWEISVPVIYQMNYNPRPVFQSYQAYNARLDSFNYTKYLSARAPDYLIYEANAIDRHYHFFDDTYLKKAMLCRYVVADTFQLENVSVLLFHKSNRIKPLEFYPLYSGTIHVNDSLQVPASKYPLLLRYHMDYNLLGKLQRLLLRAPLSEAILYTEDGKCHTYQSANSVLSGGVFTDHYIETTEDALQYFNGNREHLQRITSISVKAKHPICWNSLVRYEWLELK